MNDDDEFALPPVAHDRALHPLHYGRLSRWSGHACVTGPCGDTMEFWVRLRDGRVERASFTTSGCGSSRACGDMAATLAEGRPVDDALALGQAEILDALGGLPAETEHCALLASLTLKAACRNRRQDHVRASRQEPVKGRTQEDAP